MTEWKPAALPAPGTEFRLIRDGRIGQPRYCVDIIDARRGTVATPTGPVRIPTGALVEVAA